MPTIWSVSRRTPMRLAFRLDGGVCRIGFAFPNVGSGRWFDFGQPVPVLPNGFHVHDLYHVGLLGETGFSEVANILLLGERDGYVSGPMALAEEAIIGDRFTRYPMNSYKAAEVLYNAVADRNDPAQRIPIKAPQLDAVWERCDTARDLALHALHRRGEARLTTRVPVGFARAALRFALGEA